MGMRSEITLAFTDLSNLQDWTNLAKLEIVVQIPMDKK